MSTTQKPALRHPTPPVARRTRGLVVFAAAAAVVLVVVGATALLLSQNDAKVVGTPSPTSSVATMVPVEDAPATTPAPEEPIPPSTEAPMPTTVSPPPTTVAPLPPLEFPVIEGWTGPLQNGEEFDLVGALERGSHVIAFVWYPSYGSSAGERAAETQALYEAFANRETVSGARFEFVSVIEDTDLVWNSVRDDFGLTLPTVVCFREENHDQWSVCLPDSPQNLWAVPVPSWTVIAPDGSVVFHAPGSAFDVSQLEDALRTIAGE